MLTFIDPVKMVIETPEDAVAFDETDPSAAVRLPVKRSESDNIHRAGHSAVFR